MITALLLCWAAAGPITKPAAAQASTANEERAKIFFRQGSDAYARHDYAFAISYFEAAAKDAPGQPQVIFALAQAYRAKYFADLEQPWRLNRAVELFESYVSKVKKGRRLKIAQDHLRVLRPLRDQIAASDPLSLKERSEVGRLALLSSVEGVVVRVGDEEVTEFPETLELAPKAYEVSMEAPGYESRRATIEVSAGATVPFEVTLVALPARLQVVAPDGADIVVDGKIRGTAPLNTLEVEAGSHDVAVLKRGHYSFTRTVDLARGQEEMVKAELEGTSQRTLAWFFAGTGIALAVTSGVVGLAALGKQAQAQELEMKLLSEGLTVAEVVTYEDREAGRDRLRAAAGGTLGLAAGAGVVAALLFAFDAPRPPGGKLVPIAWLGEGGGGVAASASF